MEWFSKAVPVLGLILVGVGCGDSDEESGPSTRYYEGAESKALGAAGNQADCATCHANDDSRVGRVQHSGHRHHTSFRGGGADTLLEATNACVVGWMGGTADRKRRKMDGELEGIYSIDL